MQAANFDNWNPFILCAGILALFTAGVFILGSWKVINMMAMMKLVVVMVNWSLRKNGHDPDSSSGGNLCQRRQEQGGEKIHSTKCKILLRIVILDSLAYIASNINFMLM